MDVRRQKSKQRSPFVSCLTPSELGGEMNGIDVERIARRQASPGMKDVTGGEPSPGSKQRVGKGEAPMVDELETQRLIDDGHTDAAGIVSIRQQVSVVQGSKGCLMDKKRKASVGFHFL